MQQIMKKLYSKAPVIKIGVEAISGKARTRRRIADGVKRSFNESALRVIQSKYKLVGPGGKIAAINHSNTTKYLCSDHWIGDAADRVMDLKLHKHEGLRILDLGCGAGWFLLTARFFGHHVMGLDLNDNEMYNDLIDLLEIERINHRIEPKKPLPDLGERFDVITGYMVFFNWTGREEPWDAHEWAYFINDCRRHLVPGGYMRFSLNARRQHVNNAPFSFMPDSTANVLRSMSGVELAPNKGLIIAFA